MDREILRGLIEEGLTVRIVGERLGVSHATVRYWMTKYDLVTPRGRLWRDSHAARHSLEPTRRGTCPRHGEVRFVRRDAGFRCERCRVEAVTQRRREIKRLLVAEAGGRCQTCGYDRCIAALQFHHRVPSEKAFAVAGKGLSRSLAASRAEAAKCTLLCANCHAEVEAAERTLPYTSRSADPG
jgi:hypothetical protein